MPETPSGLWVPEDRSRKHPVVFSPDAAGLAAGRPLGQADAQLYNQSFVSTLTRPYQNDFRLRKGAQILDTLKTIRDTHPDASMAVNNYLRLCNMGHEVQVWKKARTRSGAPIADKKMQARIDELAVRVGAEYGGGADQLAGLQILTALTQGAMAMEIEVSSDLTDIVDFHAVDPSRITFQRVDTRLTPGYTDPQTNKWTALSSDQFRYLPLDPAVDEPYGRSPILSAVNIIFFQVRLLADLEAVVHAQGHPRINISVVQDAVMKAVPKELKAPGKEADLTKFLQESLQSIADMYSNINPDDAYIHWDYMDVSGVSAGSGTINLDTVIKILDSQIVTGLKMLPVLLGRNESSSNTHATVQAQIMSSQIVGLQRLIKRLMEWAYNTALILWGSQSRAVVTFRVPRSNDRLNDANASLIESNVWNAYVRNNWATNDEAAQATVGHPAVGDATDTAGTVNTPAGEAEAGGQSGDQTTTDTSTGA